MGTITKDKAGEGDISFKSTGTTRETFTREDDQGRTLTINKVDGGDIQFRVLAKTLDDLVDGGYDVIIKPSDVYSKGAVADIRAFGTFDASASAATNAATFNAALAHCFGNGKTLTLPHGIIPCDPVSYQYTGTDAESGIRIVGAQPGLSDLSASGSKTYLDFSGLTGSQVGITIDHHGVSGGGIKGLTFENIGLLGPGISFTSTVGLKIAGVADTYPGPGHLHLSRVGIERFGTGLTISGQSNYPIYADHLAFKNNAIGLSIDDISTTGLWSALEFSSNTTSIKIGEAQNQTFLSFIMQACTYGVVFDPTNGTINGITLINPYFEAITSPGVAILFGYDTGGNAVNANNILDVAIINGLFADSVDQPRVKANPAQSVPGNISLINVAGIENFNVYRINDITKTNPAVVTAHGHNLSNAEKVFIHDVNGMTEINDKVYTVANSDVAAGTFELSGIDTSDAGYTAYTFGGEVQQNDDWEGSFNGGFKTSGRSGKDQIAFSDSTGRLRYLKPFNQGSNRRHHINLPIQTSGGKMDVIDVHVDTLLSDSASAQTFYEFTPDDDSSYRVEAKIITTHSTASDARAEAYYALGVFSRISGTTTVRGSNIIEAEGGSDVNRTVSFATDGTKAQLQLLTGGTGCYVVADIKFIKVRKV